MIVDKTLINFACSSETVLVYLCVVKPGAINISFPYKLETSTIDSGYSSYTSAKVYTGVLAVLIG